MQLEKAETSNLLDGAHKMGVIALWVNISTNWCQILFLFSLHLLETMSCSSSVPTDNNIPHHPEWHKRTETSKHPLCNHSPAVTAVSQDCHLRLPGQLQLHWNWCWSSHGPFSLPISLLKECSLPTHRRFLPSLLSIFFHRGKTMLMFTSYAVIFNFKIPFALGFSIKEGFFAPVNSSL